MTYLYQLQVSTSFYSTTVIDVCRYQLWKSLPASPVYFLPPLLYISHTSPFSLSDLRTCFSSCSPPSQLRSEIATLTLLCRRPQIRLLHLELWFFLRLHHLGPLCFCFLLELKKTHRDSWLSLKLSPLMGTLDFTSSLIMWYQCSRSSSVRLISLDKVANRASLSSFYSLSDESLRHLHFLRRFLK